MTTATIKSGSINLLNTIIGAGILAMPYGLKSNGLVFGLLLIVWSALTSSFGLYLQIKVSKYTAQQNTASFFSLSQLTYPSLSVIFDLAIAIKCFGVGVSYLVIIGDLMPKIVETLNITNDLLNHRNFWITVFMAFIAPLSFLRKLDSLKYTSIVALFSVVYLIVLVVYHCLFNDTPVNSLNIEWYGPISASSTLKSFPILVFAYTCHQNMFAIINELTANVDEGSKTRQANKVIRNAIVIACGSYVVVGVTGYLTFGEDVNGNIITMYPKDSISSLIGRLCMVIMVSLSFPLQCHPCRGSVNHVVFFFAEKIKQRAISSNNTNNTRKNKSSNAQEQQSLMSDQDGSTIDNNHTTSSSNTGTYNNSDNESEHEQSFVSTTPMEGSHDTAGHDPIIVPLSKRNFIIITTAIVTFSYLLAISVTSLEHVLAFVGSTGSTSISFILPGLFGFMLIKPKIGEPFTYLELFCKYGGLCLSIWGLLVMIVCLSATIFLGASH